MKTQASELTNEWTQLTLTALGAQRPPPPPPFDKIHLKASTLVI